MGVEDERPAAARPRLRLAAARPGGQPGPAFMPEGWRLALLAALGFGLGSSAAWGGLYDVASWGPAAIAVLAGALAVTVVAPAVLTSPAKLLLGALVAFAVLAALSMSWSESPPAAAIEAHRWALYAAVFLLAATLVRGERHRRVLLGALVAGALAVDTVLVAQLLGADGPSRFFVNRLTFPMGYVNGQAAVLAAVVWPMLAVAEQARHAALRGTAAAVATLLVGLMLLTQSRGGLAALAVTALALLVLFGGRVRRAWLMLVIGSFVALVGAELIGIYSQAPAGDFTPSASDVSRAVARLLAASIGAGVLWAVVSMVAGRPFAGTPVARRVASTALAATVLAGAIATVAATGDPVDRLRTQAEQFTRLDASAGGPSRLLSGGGNRFDYWRVAVAELRAHPVAGVGAGNYVSEYYARRRSDEAVRQPHSLPLQGLAELGLLGGAAVAALLGAIGWLLLAAARSVARRDGELSAGSAVAAAGVLIAWTAHTSVDWLHLLPGLTGGALCAAACLTRPAAAPAPRSPRRRLVSVLGCGIAVCLAASGIGRLTLAAHERDRARSALTSGDPRRAIDLAARSLELQPQSLSALYTQAAGWARLDDYGRARGVLLRASALEPSNSVPRALLGDLAVRRGDVALARREYAAAVALDPRDAALRDTLRNLGPG